MKVLSQCISCFGNQISRLMIPEKEKRKLFMELFKFVVKYKGLFNDTPIELAKIIYKNKIVVDFFENEKGKEIAESFKWCEKIKKEESKGIDLIKAMLLSAKANVVDFGQPELNALKKTEITDKDIKELTKSSEELNKKYKQFLNEIKEAKKIAYLTDNAFEIGFDSAVIRKLIKLKKDVTMIVRHSSFINDLTLKDLDKYKIVEKCNLDKVKIKSIDMYDNAKSKDAIKEKNIIEELKKYDLVISKGQANYEILSEYEGKINIAYVLTVKCSMISNALKEDINNTIIKISKI